MKKVSTIIILSLIAMTSYAQTAYDALMFSENNYEGTARSVAMGNAFTALGGDLGAITINPAGSAVAGYSQFTITPSLTFSTNTAKGVPPPTDGTLTYFQKAMKSNLTSFSIPNLGVTYTWETGRKNGLKKVTFGFVANQTNSWSENVYANGTNATTSFMGALASAATIVTDPNTGDILSGYWADELSSLNAYENPQIPWRLVTGYQSGMISTFGGYDGQYVGASEVVYETTDKNGVKYDIVVGGPLDQTYGRRVDGAKNEYTFNLGGNISDMVYVGINLGISSINYTYEEYFTEKAVDPKDFAINLDNGQNMYFHQMKYKYSYQADGMGVFGKFGVIVTPMTGLRLGAAIQTPTVTSMTETWAEDGQTDFSLESYSAYSPYVEADYRLKSPMRANFGAAYTFGGLGLVSVDYEMVDYGQMKYDTNNDDREYFEMINQDIRSRFGTSHMLRAGFEIKPIPAFAIRGGYGLATSAERIDPWGYAIDKPQMTHSASFGLGFSSKGSFFADAAVQARFLQNEYFMPYEHYILNANGRVDEYSPEIENKRSLIKAFLTIGWRF